MSDESMLMRLEKIPVEIIQDFRKHGKSQAIPANIQAYIRELDAVIEIKQTLRFDNITRLSRELMIRRPYLSFRKAQELVYDAYNFFHVGDSLSEDIWDRVYADKMEDLAQLCIAKGKEEEARRCLKDAHEMRTNSKSKLKPEDFKGNIYIVSIDVRPEDLGFERGNLKEIARKQMNGHYLNLINSLSGISETDKARLKADADIVDAEIVAEDEY